VPEYDPNQIYIGGAISYGPGFGLGVWLDNDCDWYHHWVAAGAGWNHGWRDDDRRRIIERPVVTRPWSRDPRRPLPIPPRPLEDHRPGLDEHRGYVAPPGARPEVRMPDVRIPEVRMPGHPAQPVPVAPRPAIREERPSIAPPRPPVAEGHPAPAPPRPAVSEGHPAAAPPPREAKPSAQPAPELFNANQNRAQAERDAQRGNESRGGSEPHASAPPPPRAPSPPPASSGGSGGSGGSGAWSGSGGQAQSTRGHQSMGH
jgi:hypothetical protein